MNNPSTRPRSIVISTYPNPDISMPTLLHAPDEDWAVEVAVLLPEPVAVEGDIVVDCVCGDDVDNSALQAENINVILSVRPRNPVGLNVSTVVSDSRHITQPEAPIAVEQKQASLSEHDPMAA